MAIWGAGAVSHISGGKGSSKGRKRNPRTQINGIFNYISNVDKNK
jgi:hypothetical protein